MCLESMKFPGVFFNLKKKICTGIDDWDAQFRVRAEVSYHSYFFAVLASYIHIYYTSMTSIDLTASE